MSCLRLALLATVIVLIPLSPAVAQNVFRDYVLDKNAQYQPTDHWNRGGVYRVQTGHAGFFADCDDDVNKLYSPYISWGCRPDRKYNLFVDMFNDVHRRQQRFLAGAGACATGVCQHCRDGSCPQCLSGGTNQFPNPGTGRGELLGTRPAAHKADSSRVASKPKLGSTYIEPALSDLLTLPPVDDARSDSGYASEQESLKQQSLEEQSRAQIGSRPSSSFNNRR
jgi:hypothetical protein